MSTDPRQQFEQAVGGWRGALESAAPALAFLIAYQLGDLNIAEPKALIGFAGPRVIEQTIRQKLPEGFQRSEFLIEHGMLDLIVDRREMKAALTRAFDFMLETPATSRRDTAPAVAAVATEAAVTETVS